MVSYPLTGSAAAGEGVEDDDVEEFATMPLRILLRNYCPLLARTDPEIPVSMFSLF